MGTAARSCPCAGPAAQSRRGFGLLLGSRLISLRKVRSGFGVRTARKLTALGSYRMAAGGSRTAMPNEVAVLRRHVGRPRPAWPDRAIAFGCGGPMPRRRRDHHRNSGWHGPRSVVPVGALTVREGCDLIGLRLGRHLPWGHDEHGQVGDTGARTPGDHCVGNRWSTRNLSLSAISTRQPIRISDTLRVEGSGLIGTLH